MLHVYVQVEIYIYSTCHDRSSIRVGKRVLPCGNPRPFRADNRMVWCLSTKRSSFLCDPLFTEAEQVHQVFVRRTVSVTVFNSPPNSTSQGWPAVCCIFVRPHRGMPFLILCLKVLTCAQMSTHAITARAVCTSAVRVCRERWLWENNRSIEFQHCSYSQQFHDAAEGSRVRILAQW